MKRRLVIMQYTVHEYSYPAINTASSSALLSMIFKVYLMRIGGRRRTWRDILNSPAYVGDLRTVTEKRGDAIYTQALLVSTGAFVYSTQTGHSFHGKLDSDSTSNWTVGA